MIYAFVLLYHANEIEVRSEIVVKSKSGNDNATLAIDTIKLT